MKLQASQESLACFIPPICELCGQPIWAGEQVVKQASDIGRHASCEQERSLVHEQQFKN